MIRKYLLRKKLDPQNLPKEIVSELFSIANANSARNISKKTKIDRAKKGAEAREKNKLGIAFITNISTK
jgi:hypothetical protein